MTSLSDDRKVVLYSQLDRDKVERVINLGVATQIWPKEGNFKFEVHKILAIFFHFPLESFAKL